MRFSNAVRLLVLAAASSSSTTTHAFVGVTTTRSSPRSVALVRSAIIAKRTTASRPSFAALRSGGGNDETETPLTRTTTSPSLSFGLVTAAMTLLLVGIPEAAMAAGPDWGIFEGRTGSLLHPITMLSLLAYSVSTALLGFQYRRQRTIGDDIKTAQAELTAALKGASSLEAALEDAGDDAGRVAALKETVPPLQEKVDALKAERKELTASGPRDKHYGQGALLAFIGTAFAIEGPLNTYARAGKLFPGPHLYAGAGLVVCWALASACVPSMIKGNDTARTMHIGANLTGLGLFAWQVVSGIPILLKVLENTKWP